jgi:membrane protease subunit HflK
MGWNEPKNGKDPWGGQKSPPDLDEALKRFQEKIKHFFRSNSGKTNSNSPSSPKGTGIIAAIAALIIFILWALSGIFIVDPAEQAAILRFGKYVETVGPGPHWIPRFIESKLVVNVDRIFATSYF